MLHKFPFPLTLLEKKQQHRHHASLREKLIKHVLQRMLKYYKADKVLFFLKKGKHFFPTLQVCKQLDETTDKEPAYLRRSPVILTLHNDCYFHNGEFSPSDSFLKREKISLPLYAQQKLVGVTQISRAIPKNSSSSSEGTRNSLAYFATMLSQVSAISAREKLPLLDLLLAFQGASDKTTLLHSLRVAKYVDLLYNDWLSLFGFCDFSSEDLTVAALLHDLGKWCVDQEVLHKKSSLDTFERRHLAQHTFLGLRMLDNGSPTTLRKLTQIVILQHHQRCTTEQLTTHDRLALLKLRLVQMLDMYDAMRSSRSYKEPWKEKKVFEHLEQQVYELSDRMLLQLLLRRLPEMRRINENYSE